MCRLFALSAAPRRVHATFWLLEAPDSLAQQSRREPDGTGLGTFTPEGEPLVEKQPLAAYADRRFAEEAKDRESMTFLAHIRYASTGAVEPRNTHPFEQHGRLFAHNGVIADLPTLDDELGEYRSMVHGDTDSERLFALITKRIDANDGDVGAGIAAAASWVADTIPVFSLNLIVTTATEMWALRYPDTHGLFVLPRVPGGPHGDRHLDQASTAGRIRARSGPLSSRGAVVVASERMDEDPDWREVRSGELLHVDSHRKLTSTMILDRPPRRRMTLDDLGDRAAASQTAV
ncbi:class II glutamine amidotransferase [Rhodococcus sp. D2-41]|uniref:Class II glutamine amidotransferase n=1 Tax=Speluncibacter jeojiensis TaxID=2710754 RepID=A0A9X4LWU5_9ACTN|nr:class II glutamine amidotransferase [Rhodococcus sp. D2-41]MDG3010689.1 class II glutamine amidotransferase [Rhodococcus sp. D2-41]MDG3013659.1 class II glutamine amidotransferase [Corynebacteriales bacterium D3-21]